MDELKYGHILEILNRHGWDGRPAGWNKDEVVGPCIFHADGRNPNLYVNKQKNTFICRSGECGRSGGVVALLEHYGERSQGDPNEKWRSYVDMLWSADGKAARDYILGRGFQEETLLKAHIGLDLRLFNNERGGDWRLTIPIFDGSQTATVIRRYHPDGKLASPDIVTVVHDKSLFSRVKKDNTTECPACASSLKVPARLVESDVKCEGCGVSLFVHGRKCKIWGKGSSGIFGEPALAALRKTPASANKTAIITEGEWDKLILDQNKYNAFTGTAGAGTWKSEWTKLFDGLDVVVLYDNDPAGKKGASKVREAFQERSLCASLKVVSWPFKQEERLPDGGVPKDASDWFALGHTAEELREAIDVAEMLALNAARPFILGGFGEPPDDDGEGGSGGGGRGGGSIPSSIASEIDEIRCNRKMMKHHKQQQISFLVKQDMERRGRFIQTSGKELYYFLDSERRLYRMWANDLRAFLADEYLINKSERDYSYVESFLETHALQRGDLVEVRYHTYYHKPANSLYISQFNGNVCRITTTGSTIVANGTDGVLFLDAPEKQAPWTASDSMPLAEAEAEIMKYCTDIRFDETFGITKEVAAKHLFLWLTSLFYGSVMPTKPLCVFIGEAGSGKSFAFRRFLHLLYLNTDVSSINVEDADAFEAAIINTHLVILDNVDSGSKYLNDSLASVATGRELVKRKLYTTLETQRFKPTCFMGLTSRTPHYARADVVDRLVIFRAERRTTSGGEFAFLAEENLRPTDEMRSRFYSALITIGRHVLQALADGKRPKGANQRMADWTTMIICIANAMGWPQDEIEHIVKLVDQARSEFLAEETDLVEIIDKWLSGDPSRFGRHYTTTELSSELNNILEMNKEKYRFNRRSLGKRLKESLHALRRRWVVSYKHNSHKRSVTYAFDPIGSVPTPPPPDTPPEGGSEKEEEATLLSSIQNEKKEGSTIQPPLPGDHPPNWDIIDPDDSFAD